MTDTFIATALYLDNGDSISEGRVAVTMVSPSGQIESGYVYPKHLDVGTSLEDHIARRIRELFNVGLCQGWRTAYVSPSHDRGRENGTTCVWEMDFDTLSGRRSGERLGSN
jgi:hypothetical protein